MMMSINLLFFEDGHFELVNYPFIYIWSLLLSKIFPRISGDGMNQIISELWQKH